jgi:7,8-dihydropterin-6-yl-methyl-4-(beta-D-ribofuranosyl)aminobenzene 5'-phosphate synthase
MLLFKSSIPGKILPTKESNPEGNMSLRITTLNDNTAGMGNFLAEWGLSLLVETGDITILLDTGTETSAVRNAEALGIDLSRVDKIVLSHGHGDHTGGLMAVLRKMQKEVEIIAHPDIWQIKYDKRRDKPARFIGLPFRQEALESLGARFHLTRDPLKITDSILTTGEVPMTNSFEEIDKFIFVKEGQDLKPDLVRDDLALIIKTELGLVILPGCAHRGIINTIHHAQQITGVKEVYAVIGGSHLIGTSEERLWQTISALKEMDIKKLGLCHCTDIPAISTLTQEFGENFIINKAGMVIDLL